MMLRKVSALAAGAALAVTAAVSGQTTSVNDLTGPFNFSNQWGSGGVASQFDVLFNNFGPGDSYTTGTGWTIGTSTDWIQGSAFTVDPNAPDDYYLNQLVAAISHVTGTNAITISVYDTDGNGLPGNVLETVTGSNFQPFGQGNPPSVFSFSGNTILERGEQYFFIANANDGPSGDWLVWNQNDQGDSGPHAQKQGAGGAWTVGNNIRGAMRIEGTLIPAPGALALLGLAGLIGTRRRRA